MNQIHPPNTSSKETTENVLVKSPTFLTFYDLDSQILLASRVGSADNFNNAKPLTTGQSHVENQLDNKFSELMPIDMSIMENKNIISINRSGKELDNLKALYTKRSIKSAPVRRNLITANSCYLNTGTLNIFIKANKLSIPSRPTTSISRKSKYSSRSLVSAHSRQHPTSSNISDKENNNSNKNNNKIMEGIEENAEQYHMKPLDNDTRQFSNNKKVINKQIKGYWKQDLSEIEKGKLRKLTNPTFDDNEWMTIKKPNNENSTPKNNEPLSIIDTFTADIQESEIQMDPVSTYKVSPFIGTMIANKISNGERIRVGVNGKFINENENENINNTSLEKLLETNKFYDPASVLSWQQQIKKNDIKVISPTVNTSNINKIAKYDRNLVVKKLVDEEEFLPCYAKNSSSQSPETSSRLSAISERSQPTAKPRQNLTSEPRIREYRIPVEVIGTNSVGHPFQQHMQKAEITNAMQGAKKVELKLPVQKQRPVISLNEKNYIQLVDNLTQKYTDAVLTAKQQYEVQHQSQQQINSLYVNMTNSLNVNDKVKFNPNPKFIANNEKCVSADFISRDLLGVNGFEEPSKIVKNSVKFIQNCGHNTSNNKRHNAKNSPIVVSKTPVLFKNDTKNNFKSIIHDNINTNNNSNSLLINPNHSNSSHNLNETLNQSQDICLIQNTLDTNTIDTCTLCQTLPEQKKYKYKDTDCLITIKSFHSSNDNGEVDLPDTPLSYSSFKNSFNAKRPLINNFNTRAKISIDTPHNLGYLNNYGHSPQLNSLGGGFYYNSRKKKNIPSGYYKFDRSKHENIVKSPCCLKSSELNRHPKSGTVSALETKYLQITKPIIRKSSLFSCFNLPTVS